MCQQTGGSANSGPQALWQAPPPPPLKGNKKLVPSTKAAKIQARCGMGLELLQIFTLLKKKSPVRVEMTRSAFPLAAHSRAHGSVQVLNGSAKLINLLGQQTPLPCGLAIGPVPTSPLAPKQRCGSSFPGRRQEGQHPRKKKTLLLLATACVLTKGNINYSVHYCLKQNKTNKQTHAISQGGLF